MKRSRRRTALIAAASVAAVLLTSCAGGGESPGQTSSGIKGNNLEGVTFAFAMPSSAAAVYVAQQEEFVTQAKKLGAKVKVYDNNADASTMLSNAQLMVAAKPDVIVEFPSTADATDRVGQTFTGAGIPCIALNVPVKGCSFFNYDQQALSALAAEAVAAKMKARNWDGTNTSVVIGQASTLGSSVNIAVTSFYAKLSELVPGMTKTVAASIGPSTTAIGKSHDLQSDMGLTVDSGYTAMKTALQIIPSGNHVVVYPVSDDTTRGALRALDEAGRSSEAMVSGYGGDPAALKALRSGGAWTTDQIGFFPNWGEFVLAMAVAIHDGAKPPVLTVPPQVVVTKENVDKYFKPDSADVLIMPSLPKESEYLLKTGILQKFGNVEGAE